MLNDICSIQKSNPTLLLSRLYSFLSLVLLVGVITTASYSQTFQSNFAQGNQNYLQNSQTFRQVMWFNLTGHKSLCKMRKYDE